MSPVLFVADLFHPLDILAVHRFLNGDMRHRGRGRRPVPVLLPGRKPDHITGPEFIDRSALALNPAAAGCDDQSLAERMRVPGGAGTRLECDAALHQSAPAYAWRVVRLGIEKAHASSRCASKASSSSTALSRCSMRRSPASAWRMCRRTWRSRISPSVVSCGCSRTGRPPYSGYHLYYPSRRQPSAAFALLVDALRHRA